MLHDELMAHAAALVRPKRSSEVQLRRAISAAYYSVFHGLLWDCTEGFDSAQRAVIVRWYSHSEVKRVCLTFAQTGKRREDVAKLLAGTAIPPELGALAGNFITLHEARERADYDLVYIPKRQEGTDLVDRARRVHDARRSVADGPAFRMFLFLVGRNGRVVQRSGEER